MIHNKFKTNTSMTCFFLRGHCTPDQKLACFVLYLKVINIFMKNIYASYSKLSNELKKWHWNLSRPISSWVIDQNIILTVLIHNLKTAWPTIISMPFLKFLGQYTLRCMHYFLKKILIIWRLHTKHANFGLVVQYPLKVILNIMKITMYLISRVEILMVIL